MASRFTVETIFTAVDRFSAPVLKMTKALESFGKTGKQISKFNTSLKSGLSEIESFGRFALTTGAVGAYTLARGIGAIAGAFSQVETAQTNFRVMLDGNAQLANTVVDQLYKKAAETSFGFNDLANATTRLFTSGAADTKNLDAKLTMLGDLAMGSPDKLERLSLVYSQITSNMKADTRDLQQFGDLGIPLKIELMKDLGMETNQFKKELEEGRISSEMVERTLKRLTGPGGKFAGALSERAKTLAGRWDNLTEKIRMGFARIGKAAEPAMKRFVEVMIKKVDSVLAWLDKPENQKKIEDFANRFVDALLKIVNFIETHWEGILTTFKWAAILYGGGKVVSMLLSIANILPKIATLFRLLAFTPIGRLVTLLALVIDKTIGWEKALTVLSDALNMVNKPFEIFYDMWDWLANNQELDLKIKLPEWLENMKSLNMFVPGLGTGFSMAKWLGEKTGMLPENNEQSSQPMLTPMVSPQERIVQSISESTTTNKTELIINDKSGAAELKAPKLAHSLGIKLGVSGEW